MEWRERETMILIKEKGDTIQPTETIIVFLYEIALTKWMNYLRIQLNNDIEYNENI